MTTTVQNYLDKGLRGLWYPVLASWEVQSAPVGITRLGEQIVVWRNKDGQVQALEDRCPHRGARLSMGWNLGDRIACWYHGVEVAGNGEVKNVPAVDKCPLVGQQCVRSYNVQEAHGAIFLWFGVTTDQQPDELTFPDELADTDSFSNFLCTAAWKCNYQYALENVMDETPQLMTDIVRQVDDPRLGLCLDVGHANTCASRTPPMEWIAPMAPYLRHVHLHNNVGDWDLHSSLGEGSIPMQQILAALLEQCPASTWTIENQDCAPSLAWLAQQGYLSEE